MKHIIISALLILATMTGCTHVISDQARRLADPAISFGVLREAPDNYIGKYVLLGGMIAGVKNTKSGGEIEVVQLKLESSGMPEDPFVSGGRFIVTAPGFLDTLIYKTGRMITVVGEVKGKRTSMLDEVEYTYPVIAIKEMYVWRSYDTGNGYPYSGPGPYYNYDPYYYGYWPGPHWYRPMGPVFRRW